MAKKRRIATRRRPLKGEGQERYESTLQEIVGLLDRSRCTAARSVNAVMTAAYWEVGRRVVELEQGGEARAEYGKQVLGRLAVDLTGRFGRGFSERNLRQMRQFYLVWSVASVDEVKSGTETGYGIRQTASAESDRAQPFPLPWSHYVELLRARSPDARAFYEREALAGGWTIRQLKRQMGSQFFERAALSKNKAAMLTKEERASSLDRVTPEEEIKDPLVLEFLDLKDEYSESELEEALIRELEGFLLELGGDFTFVGRQRRLRIDDVWFRVDLVLYHRRLRCLVIVDLKLGEFSHADAGQMNVYLNYARRHWTHPDENPPVGLILCLAGRRMLAEYALEGIENKVLAAEYQTKLPDAERLAKKLEDTRKALAARATKREDGE